MKIQSGIAIQPKVENPDQKIREAAQAYERHFLNEMVKAMRNTVQHTSEPSMANRVFTDKMFDEYTDTWAKNGGVGLADIIYTQLKERYFPDSARQLQHPQGPVPLDKSKMIPMEGSKSSGIPSIQEQGVPDQGLNYLFKMEGADKVVKNPWDGEVLQCFRTNEDVNLIKVGHDNGLVSTISYEGTSANLSYGELLKAGQEIGRVSPDTNSLNWGLVQIKGKA